MTIFGRWLRANGHDALSSLDFEATRAAIQKRATFERDLKETAAKVQSSLAAERDAALQERKEQSIIAARMHEHLD